MSGEPNFSINFTAPSVATANVGAGDCLLYDTANGVWKVATSANRTAANVGTQGIALGPTSSQALPGVPYQSSGIVSASVSGLTSLTPGSANQLVRTSSSGRLERVSSYTSGDDIVGYATWDGRVALHLGLPWESIATFAGVSPGGATYSMQYKVNTTTLGGSTGVSVDGTGSALQLGTGAFATVGLVRVAYNTGAVLSAKDSGATNRNVISQSTSTWTFGSSVGWITNVEGAGVVVKSFGAGLVLDSSQQDTRISGVNKQTLTASVLATGVPRIGLSVPWGASEGTSTITASGTYTLIDDEFDYAHNVFSSASTGTYTYPAPSTQQTYFRWLQETGGASKTITIGSGTTYTLAANSSVWVRFQSTGVFALPTTGTATEGQMLNTLTGGTYSLTPTAKILKFSGSPGGTDTITLPTPGSAAASNVLHFRNTSTNTAITFKLASGVTFTTGYNSVGTLFVTPDGVSGYSLNTIPGVSAVTT